MDRAIPLLLLLLACADKGAEPVDSGAVALPGDSGGVPDPDTDTIPVETGTTDTGTVEPTPTSAPVLTASSFCAGGGWSTWSDAQGVLCFGPADLAASSEIAGASHVWRPGPVYTLDPAP